MTDFHLTVLLGWLLNLMGRALVVAAVLGSVGGWLLGGVAAQSAGAALGIGFALSFLIFAFQLLYATPPMPIDEDD